MLRDPQYSNYGFAASECPHHYGLNVHILADPYLFTLLTRLCSPQCQQPELNHLLHTLYRGLLQAVLNQEFPKCESSHVTRMESYHPQGHFWATVIDPSTQAVCVNLARAGTLPSQICFDALNAVLKPEGVRQDHIAIARKVDSQGKVVGAELGGLKIGGDVENRILLIPDPMGATGSTLATALELFRQHGTAKKYIAMHLVVTPEYLKTVTTKFPMLTVYALRLDRGLSNPAILETVPGTHWEQERGLNDLHYVVPGAGGLGEVLNNSFV